MFQTRQAVVTAPRTLALRTRDIPAPTGDRVVIAVRASAICGSDLHIYKGLHPSVSLPATIGHEFAGDIVAAGEGVRRFSVGERVVVEPCDACGVCGACRRGQYSQCPDLTFLYRTGEGALADYVTVPERCLYPLPEDMDYVTGSLIEPMAVAAHAVRAAKIRLDERVLIVGAGAIGLMAAGLCALSGARVTVCDGNEYRLSVARAMGARETCLPGQTEARAYDKAFECVGKQVTLLSVLAALKPRGLATVVGIFEQPQVSLDISRVVTGELRMQGAQGYCHDFETALAAAQRLDIWRLATHTFPLAELDRAFDTLFDRDANAVKAVMLP